MQFLDDNQLVHGSANMPIEAIIPAASWRYLATGGLKRAYSELKGKSCLSASVAWGQSEKDEKRGYIPRILHWAACRGIVFNDPNSSLKERMRAMAAIVTRLMLQAQGNEIILYKIDKEALGTSFSDFSTLFPGKLATNEREIESFFIEFQDYIKKNPLNGNEWRFMKNDWVPSKQPLLLVCIADVQNLSANCLGILDSLLTESVGARHGIYFMLSSQKSDVLSRFDHMPQSPKFVVESANEVFNEVTRPIF